VVDENCAGGKTFKQTACCEDFFNVRVLPQTESDDVAGRAKPGKGVMTYVGQAVKGCKG
jgi:hypothetical protein